MGKTSFAAWMLVAASTAWAVEPAEWSHSTEADFAAGKLDKTVLTSLGEVLLARDLDVLLKPDDELGMVSAIAVDRRGKVFVAVAPGGTIYRVEKGKCVKFAELPGAMVRYLAFEDAALVAGVCGEKAGLYRIDAKGKVSAVWTDKDVTYVWAVVAGPRKSHYVATGPEGKVYRVTGGKAEVIYDSEDKNILSLAAGAGGKLYAGTGESGLIVQIDPSRKAGRVLYDAPESEISAIVSGPDGVVYAATSDATKAGASGEQPSGQVRGKPDKAPAVVPAPMVESPATQPARSTAPAPRGAVNAPKRPAASTGRAQAPAPGPRDTGPVIRSASRPRPSRRPAPGAPAEGKGNAVYRIDAGGFVRAVFRRPVTLWAMVLRDGVLTLATGHGGQMFAIDLADDRTSMVAQLDPKDVTALAVDAKGKLVLGTADKAAVFAIGTDLARKGTLTSEALDAKQIAQWGTARVRADVPAWCSATIATRSGNVEEPDDKTWSTWSREMSVDKGWTRIASPAGRFLQYRLTLSRTGKSTPRIDHVRLVYQVQNLAPAVRAVQVVPSPHPKQRDKTGGPKPFRMIQIQATDPNGDPLSFKIEFRRLGHRRWITLAEKLGEPKYAWDTTGLAEGTYEVRVEASDTPSNPPPAALAAARISRPVVVDNAPPAVKALKAADGGKGTATFSGTVTDATSRIVRIHYAVDTNDEWVAVLPTDGMCDSQTESFSVRIAQIEPGAHRLAVRVVDEYGNTGYDAVEVDVAP